jgi:putative FmdB family regulatory protein
MPMYEYYCSGCNGVFELLRPVREASYPQPCPVCDTDSRRLMPTDFAAFVVREGLPRRIPDTGKYWTREGLSDFAETGDAYQQPPGGAAWAKGFATSEDDDKEEIRQRIMRQQEEINNDRGGIPEIDADLGQQMADYQQKVVNTQLLKKKLKRPTNNEVTPRTRTGSHLPSKLVKKKGDT